MDGIYQEKKKNHSGDIASKMAQEMPETSPSMQALMSGAAAPTSQQLGRRVDLPEAIRAKMESSFGADLSGVRLYESQAVESAGAQAIAQGNRIAFVPGKLDFTSRSGQALLGHEISHLVSQARGEASGSGFLDDSALESRADQEGMMAALGQQIYSPATAEPISAAGAQGFAAPMQAKKDTTAHDNRRLSRMSQKSLGRISRGKGGYFETRKFNKLVMRLLNNGDFGILDGKINQGNIQRFEDMGFNVYNYARDLGEGSLNFENENNYMQEPNTPFQVRALTRDNYVLRDDEDLF